MELPGQVRGARKLQHPRELAVLLRGPEQSVFTSISSDQAVPLGKPGKDTLWKKALRPQVPPWEWRSSGLSETWLASTER